MPRTPEEIAALSKARHQRHYQRHRPAILESHRKAYKIRSQEKMTCPCGSTIKLVSKSAHLLTKRHRAFTGVSVTDPKQYVSQREWDSIKDPLSDDEEASEMSPAETATAKLPRQREREEARCKIYARLAKEDRFTDEERAIWKSQKAIAEMAVQSAKTPVKAIVLQAAQVPAPAKVLDAEGRAAACAAAKDLGTGHSCSICASKEVSGPQPKVSVKKLVRAWEKKQGDGDEMADMKLNESHYNADTGVITGLNCIGLPTGGDALDAFCDSLLDEEEELSREYPKEEKKTPCGPVAGRGQRKRKQASPPVPPAAGKVSVKALVRRWEGNEGDDDESDNDSINSV